MMIVDWAKDLVLRLVRVPAQPHAPEGAEESVRVFNAARNYFVWRLILWGLANVAIALVLLVAFAPRPNPKPLPPEFPRAARFVPATSRAKVTTHRMTRHALVSRTLS